MQQAGYSVSREVLLAIRQGNQQRVEHLVEGLVAALRLQRSGGAPPSGDGHRPQAGAPQDPVEAGGAPAHAWGQGVNLGTSVEQFAFAVQRLSRMPLGPQRAPFWDEVSGFVSSVAGELRAKELALFSNAFATGAPERLAGPLGAALLCRAAAVADELSAQDLVMVMHGLSRAAGPGSPHGADIHTKTQGKPGVRMPKAVKALAWASRQVRLEEDRPQQAALLLNAFVRLQHAHDAPLFGRWFGFACKTLPAWDAQALALLCKAFAAAPLAQARTTESGWRAVAGRCAAVVGGANGRDIATLAQTLQRLSVPSATVAEFYDRLERLLVERRRIVDFLSAGQFAMVAQGLGRHRQPPGSAAEGVSVTKAASEAPAGTASLAKNIAEEGVAITAPVVGRGGCLDPPGPVLPATEWPFEEHAERRMRDFTEQDLAFVLDASVRLQRGGIPLLRAISRRLTSFDGKLSALVLGKICESTVKAVPLVGLSECIDLLKVLRKECTRLTPQLVPWEVSAVAAAYALAGAATPPEKGRRWRIWKSKEQARTALDSLCTRAEEVSPNPEWLESVHSQVRLVMQAEGLLVKPAPVQQAVHREGSASAGDLGE